MRRIMSVLLLLVASCGPRLDPVVEPSDIQGEEWPVTIPSFRVDCTNGLDVFIVDAQGIGYQIRGGEKSGAEAYGGQVRDLMDIRKRDLSLQELSPGVRLSFAVTRREALSRCVEAGVARFDSY